MNARDTRPTSRFVFQVNRAVGSRAGWFADDSVMPRLTAAAWRILAFDTQPRIRLEYQLLGKRREHRCLLLQSKASVNGVSDLLDQPDRSLTAET